MADPSAPTRSAAFRPLLASEELPTPGLKVVVHEGRQVLLARTASGTLHALDNRCPHEGYPLSQGELGDDTLTCCWHNWRFALSDGSCLLGGEGVATYPVREVDGRIEVDVRGPDPAARIPALLESFEEGLYEHDNSRALRDAARLLQAGRSPFQLLADVAASDGRRAEYGSTHTLPVAADLAGFAERRTGVDALYALAPAIDLCGESNIRLPDRPAAPALSGATQVALRDAVEERDLPRAEGLLRGAWDAGVPRTTIEGWLYAIASDHFTDFGHQLIYLVKSQELLDRVGDEHALPIHVGLVTALNYATREDTLPYMGIYSRFLEEHTSELAQVYARRDDTAPFAPEALRDAVLEGSHAEALDALWQSLVAGVPAAAVARALVAAAAERLLRFDTDLDDDPEVAETWLWATHRFTFAAAVRHATERWSHPDALRFLFQAVMFVHSGRRLDAPVERRLPTAPSGDATDVDGVLAAIAAHDPAAAVARAAAIVDGDGPVTALQHALEDLCLTDPLVRPIFLAHAIKTTVAAFEEHAALAGCADRRIPVLAVVRLLATPLAERRIHEAVGRALSWVVDGKMLRKLTQ